MVAKQSPQDLGKRGEAIASRYLADQGWIELEHNWRPHAQGLRGEIDLVAIEPRGAASASLVFVEVKTPQLHPLRLGPLSMSPTPSYTNCAVGAAWLESIPAPGPHLGWM